MSTILTCNLDTGTVTMGGSAWTPRKVAFNETLCFGLRFVKLVAGSTIDAAVTMQWLKATLGQPLQAPEAGTVRLVIGTAAPSTANTTTPVHWLPPTSANAVALGCDPAAADRQMEAEWTVALNALTAITALYGAAVVTCEMGNFSVIFGAGTNDVVISATENRLTPTSLLRLASAQGPDGRWVQQVWFEQAPLALCTGFDLVLPPQPKITRKTEGGTDSASNTYWNEQQDLYVPPDFLGQFCLRRGYVRSAVMDTTDGPDQVAAAVAVFGATIAVTLPTAFHFLLEYKDTFQGQSQVVPDVVITDAPLGDVTFSIFMGEGSLQDALKTNGGTVTAPFAVRASIDDTGSGNFREVTLFTLNLTVQAGAGFAELEAVQQLNLVRPPSLRSYVPYSESSVIVGQDFRYFTVGGENTKSFSCTHNMDTDAIGTVALRDNATPGRMYFGGVDFSVLFNSSNALTVTLADAVPAPAAGALEIIICAARTIAAFAAGLTVTIDQVAGLRTWMDNVGSNVATLMALLPSTNPGVTTSGTGGSNITIPSVSEILFAPLGATLTTLSRHGPYLLGACNTLATTSLPAQLPAPAANQVWSVATPTTIAGAGRIPSAIVPAGGYVGSDGRSLYQVNPSAGTNSFFAAAYERVLAPISIDEREFAVGRTLDYEFAVALQAINATCEVQCSLRLEWGVPMPVQTPAGPPAPDTETLGDVTWQFTPLLDEPIVITSILRTHSAGCRIARTTTGITCDTMFYGSWRGATSAAPTQPNFLLRARLTKFMPRGTAAGTARGWIYYQFGSVTDPSTQIIVAIS